MGARGSGRSGPGMNREVWEVLLHRAEVWKQAGLAGVRSGPRRGEGGLNYSLAPVNTIWTPDAE